MANLHSTATVRSAIAIEETETEVIVTAQIPQIAAENVEIRVGLQALLLWGEQMERVKIDGYCDFSYPAVQFRKLIALPHPVQPEAATIEFQTDALILTLLKSVAIPC